MADKPDRRCFLVRGITGAAGLGAAAYQSIEEDILLAAMADGSARPASSGKPKTEIPSGSMPNGKIGGVSISRLIIGGNLIGGSAHARDLAYISKLFKAYNTEAKIFETLELAQDCGINTIQIDARFWDTVQKYNKNRATKLQIIANPPLLRDKAKMADEIKQRVDEGATLLYSQGSWTDGHFMRGGKIDALAQMLDLVKAQGVPAGVGCHSLEVVKLCEQNKLGADFYFKTFHSDRYWSATPKEQRKEFDWMAANAGNHNANNDGMWCNNPEETAAYMETVEKPWFAFKVMAAGAIPPWMAFPYAFRGGADFIVAGMFDFQVEADAKVTIDAVKKVATRKRPWRA